MQQSKGGEADADQAWVRVALQHRRRMCREMLAEVVRQHPGLRLVGTAATAEDLLTLCEWGAPEVVLLEIEVDAWDPCWLASMLHRRQPGTRFVAMGTAAIGGQALRALEAGLSTLVSDAQGVEPVVEALIAAPRQPAVPITVPPAVAAGPLSSRELQVLDLVALGMTSHESSRRLGISAKTVENHKQRLFAKLGVQNQAHAVAVAIRTGLMRGVPECRAQ